MTAPRLPWRILSHFQATALFLAQKEGRKLVRVSLDLGLTEQQVELCELGARIEEGLVVSWADIERIGTTDNSCFLVHPEGIEAIRSYSEETARTYQLMPTAGAPALLISGFVMHRIRDVNPEEGAQKMVKALLPIRGRLLDTATGLGYAALEAARTATEVITIEVDPGCQDMIANNPWSAPLLTDSKIKQVLGDSSVLIGQLDSASFSRVLHDPPAINLAGELYSEAFYAEVHRVLSRGGRMFHYIGDPTSSSGRRVTQGVIRRMQSAGFTRVVDAADAFGVVGHK
jgi:predicted methyltransferase